MTPHELQLFLTTHIQDIFSFMDYEATLKSTDEFAHHLANYWFSNPEFDGRGYVFVHLGHDGAGGHFAAWVRGDELPAPIVFFGSEGGTGVLAASMERWPHILAHAPWISERHGRPSEVTEVRSDRFDDDEEEDEEPLIVQLMESMFNRKKTVFESQ